MIVINVGSTGAFPYISQPAHKRDTSVSEPSFNIEDRAEIGNISAPDSAGLIASRAETTAVPYDTKHMTLQEVWDLATELGRNGSADSLQGAPSQLLLFSMTHPPRIDGGPPDPYPQSIDLFQTMTGYIDFAKSHGDSHTAKDLQSFLNWFQSFADKEGVIHIPPAV